MDNRKKVPKTPYSVGALITNKCNLRCRHCLHFSSAGDTGQDLPTEEWLKFFQELNRCHVFAIGLSGGEPFLRPDIKELIAGIVSNRMRFQILSNGTLLNEEIVAYIASTRRCIKIQISLDGANKETHDHLRGQGSFDKALRGIELLKKHQINLQVAVSIHKKNLWQLEDIAKFIFDELELSHFCANFIFSMGLCNTSNNDLLMTAKERSLALAKIAELRKKYAGRKFINAANCGAITDSRVWLAMERARVEKRDALPRRGYLSRCGRRFSDLVVRADGAIIPCTLLTHSVLGHINKDDLRDVWQNSPELNRQRERCNIPLTNFEFCRGCEYINYCTGFCSALAYNFVGDSYHPSPESCLRKFLAEGGTLPRETIPEEYDHYECS